MPSISIGPLDFKSKIDAEKYIREVLESHRPAHGVAPLSPSAALFAKDLLDLHPHKDIVIGPGIAAFYCQKIMEDKLRFLAKRTDGTYWDFSWRNCISPPTPSRRLLAILRNEVQYQIDQYRESIEFPLICEVSGETINRINCHIDHIHPDTFSNIAESWLLATGYSPDSIEITHKDKYGGRSSIKDRTIASQWKTYHQSNAKLRPVSIKANLSTLRKSK